MIFSVNQLKKQFTHFTALPYYSRRNIACCPIVHKLQKVSFDHASFGLSHSSVNTNSLIPERTEQYSTECIMHGARVLRTTELAVFCWLTLFIHMCRSEEAPRTCYYKMVVEWSSVLGKSAFSCLELPLQCILMFHFHCRQSLLRLSTEHDWLLQTPLHHWGWGREGGHHYQQVTVVNTINR